MNIYIGGLTSAVTEDDLSGIFCEYGDVKSVKVIKDMETGQSRGFGFVEMNNESEGEKAIEELDSAELDGKTITVNKAKPRENRRGGRDNNRRQGGYNRR